MATRKSATTRTRRTASRRARTDAELPLDDGSPELGRPVWKGILSLGLVNIPVTLHAAERRSEISFRMLDGRNRAPVRYERVNAETGEPVPWEEIVKGYEYEKGSYVMIDKEEIRAAAPKGTETVDIEAFVDREAISPMLFETPYYLLPGKGAEKGYVLLRDALTEVRKVGVARVIIRTREHLAILMPVGPALVLNLLRYDQEVVKPRWLKLPDADPARYRITKREVDMARQVVDSMSGAWKPSEYRDEFRDRLMKLIEDRIESGGRIARPDGGDKRSPRATTNVVDFLPLLKKSLEQKRGARAESRRAAPAKRARRRSA